MAMRNINPFLFIGFSLISTIWITACNRNPETTSVKASSTNKPKPGENMTPDNMHCSYWNIQTGDPEGDQIWWWGESFPPRKPQLTLKVATGEFEGLSGIGTWHEKWPSSHKKPATLEGYDYALACDFIFDMPVN
jgi:hypothetical protein